MKRLLVLILVLTLLVITGTIVSADGQTRLSQSNTTQTLSPTELTITLAKSVVILISTKCFEHTEASDGIR